MANVKADAIGRKQPSKYRRKKRALNAARHRWKHKWTLVPGAAWNQRSLADKMRHLAAAKKGGAVTGAQVKEQMRLFWNWDYGNCKAHLREPFKTVVETFDQIEAEHLRRYGRSSHELQWEGFRADVITSYVLRSCNRMKPDAIERELWDRYRQYIKAEGAGLYEALYAYEDARELKRLRLSLWLDRLVASKKTKTT